MLKNQDITSIASGNPQKSKFNVPVHTQKYSLQYHQKLNGMVEKQMRLAATATANFWYTAWVNAGKPDLTDLDPVDQTKRNKSKLHRELKLLQLGKVSQVAPVDKMSVAIAIILSSVLLHEIITWKILLGTILIIAGSIVIIL